MATATTVENLRYEPTYSLNEEYNPPNKRPQLQPPPRQTTSTSTSATVSNRRHRNRSVLSNCFLHLKKSRNVIMLSILACLLFGLIISGAMAANVPPEKTVKMFFVGMRHGNRNPAMFLKGDTSHEQWAWQGTGQLTNIGRRQAYTLGQFLRNRYGKLVPDDFFPDKVKAFSSSAERCQQTLQSCMAGFFPPKGHAVWNPALQWQPIPYEISDPLLRMYNVKCPEYTNSYATISNDTASAAKTWLNKNPELVKYIAEQSGFKPTLSDLADAADNIGNMKLFNQPLPSWVTNPTLPGYTSKDMEAAIMSFGEAHQVLCADDPACARMMSGLWLDQVIKVLQDKQNNTLTDRVANFYAAHTETVLSLIRLMKAKDVAETPTSAGFILEYTDSPAPAVRFLFHEPDANNPDIRHAEVKKFEFCHDQEWCPLDTFISNVKKPAFNDWRSACGLGKCPDAEG